MSDPAPDNYRYWAFISYSSRDRKWARWLHNGIEHYRVPKQFVGRSHATGSKLPRRLKPVFRDRDELPASANLGQQLEAALRASRHLIIICSPRSARSPWVAKEIEYFRNLGRPDQTLALIVDGEPKTRDDRECFPPPLRSAEPIAADARKQGDGKLDAHLKLMSGMLGVGFDALKRRDAQRRAARMRLAMTVVLLLLSIFAALGLYANYERLRANVERDNALTRESESKTRLAHSYVLKGWKTFDDGNAADSLLWQVEAFRVLMTRPEPVATATQRNHRTRIARLLAHSAAPPASLFEVPASPWYAEVSADGTRLAVVMADRTAQMFTVPDGEPVGNRLELSEQDSVRFSEDGSLLLSSTGSALRSDTGAPHAPLPPGSPQLAVFDPGAAFSGFADIQRTLPFDDGAILTRDGSFLIARTTKGLEIFDKSGRSRRVLDTAQRVGDGVNVMGSSSQTYLALSSDSRFLFASFAGAHQFFGGQTWDLKTGKLTGEIHHPFNHAVFSPDGTVLATVGRDLAVRLWSTTGVEIAAPLRHGATIASADFVNEGSHLLTTCVDRAVRVWPVRPYRSVMSPVEPPADAVWSPGLTGQPEQRELLDRINASIEYEKFAFVVLNQDRSMAAVAREFGWAGGNDGFNQIAEVWQVSPLKKLFELRHPSAVSAITFGPSGKLMATGTSEGSVRLWRLAGGAHVPPVMYASREVTLVVVNPEERRLVAGSEDSRVRVFDLDTGLMIAPPLAVPYSLNVKELVAQGDRVSLRTQWWGRGRMDLGDRNPAESLALGYIRDVALPWRDDWQRGSLPPGTPSGQIQGMTWRLTPTDAPIKRLQVISRLVSSRKIDDNGDVTSLSASELIAAHRELATHRGP